MEVYILILGLVIGAGAGYLYGLHVCIKKLREVLQLSPEQVLAECKARGIDVS